MRFRDIEKRLADLERQAAWRRATDAREEADVPPDDDYVGSVLDILAEQGVLPSPGDYDDVDVWADAVIAELKRWQTIAAPH